MGPSRAVESGGGNRQRPSGGAGTAPVPGRRKWPPWPVVLLVLALVIPWVIHVGPVALSAYRLVLLVLVVPCALLWARGRAGAIRAPDLLILAYCLWCAIALMAVHGAGGAEPGGILVAETAGAYLVGRCFVRCAEDFRATVRALFVTVALLLPFALVETATGVKLILKLFGAVLPTLALGGTELRLGLTRVQGPFDHPILFGVFCAGLLALTHLVLGHEQPPARRWLMTLIVAATAMLSWSSGPLVAIAAQAVLLTWNRVFAAIAGRWYVLAALVGLGYLAIELAANQPVPQLLTRFAFDPWTAYYRLLIWTYGWNSIFLNPVFGTGFNEWVRPAWMPASIDMFWLVPAIRHGLPALALLAGALLALIVSIVWRARLDAQAAAFRTAFLITIVGFFLAGWTVHFWNATYVLFFFLLGSGMWLVDAAMALDPISRQRSQPGSRPHRRAPAFARSRLTPTARARG